MPCCGSILTFAAAAAAAPAARRLERLALLQLLHAPVPGSGNGKS